MSVRSKSLRWNEHGDPILTIVAEGSHDVYRLANHMQKGQCEFAAIGYKVMRGLRRRWTRGQWAWLQDYMHGKGGFS